MWTRASFALLLLIACDPPNTEGLVDDVACPSDSRCPDASGAFRVGAARRVITPVVESWDDEDGDGVRGPGEAFDDVDGDGRWDPVWIAGFDPGRAATGVHDDTWARALSISRGETRLGIVVLDLLGVSHDDVVDLRMAAQARGLDVDHMAVVATHTHESQDPLGFGGAHLIASGYDRAYNERVIAQALDALAEAIDAEREATMTFARSAAPHLVADSRLPEVIDATITALRFDSAEGPIATVVIWGNHAEALGGENTLVSSDYPHYLRRELEAAYPGAVAFYMPGALGGLMNPMDIAGCPDEAGRETCATGTFEKAEYVGAGAAAIAIEALESAPTTVVEPALAFGANPFLLRVTTPEILGAVQLGVIPRRLFRTDGTRVTLDEEPTAPALPWDEVLLGDVRIQTEVNVWTIGPLRFLALPGELYPELWLQHPDGTSLAESRPGADYPFLAPPPSFQSLLPEEGTTSVLINQANDAVGYIVPRSQWDRLPPHTYGDDAQYGEGVSLGSHVAGALREAVREMR